MRSDSPCSRITSVLVILVLSSGLCLAQSRNNTQASLAVTIRDPSGALINNASVQLIRNGKVENAKTTNQQGEARFTRLVAGRYQVHVEAPGFKAADVDVPELQ